MFFQPPEGAEVSIFFLIYRFLKKKCYFTTIQRIETVENCLLLLRFKGHNVKYLTSSDFSKRFFKDLEYRFK